MNHAEHGCTHANSIENKGFFQLCNFIAKLSNKLAFTMGDKVIIKNVML